MSDSIKLDKNNSLDTLINVLTWSGGVFTNVQLSGYTRPIRYYNSSYDDMRFQRFDWKLNLGRHWSECGGNPPTLCCKEPVVLVDYTPNILEDVKEEFEKYKNEYHSYEDRQDDITFTKSFHLKAICQNCGKITDCCLTIHEKPECCHGDD